MQAVDISRVEYEPSDLDILYAEGIASSNGLACTAFTFPRTASEGCGDDGGRQQDALVRLVQLLSVMFEALKTTEVKGTTLIFPKVIGWTAQSIVFHMG